MSVARRRSPVVPVDAALALLCGASTSSCAFVEATTHNLDELHAGDGRHKRSGNIQTPYAYIVSTGLKSLLRSVGSKNQVEQPTSAIEDPTETCVDELNRLAHFDAHDPRTAAQQTVYFAWLARFDPWNLSREIAVRQLGKAGVRLALAAHPEPAPVGAPASVDQVRDGVRQLVEAATPLVRDGDDSARAQFDAACAALGELVLDVEGGSRVLRAVSIIEAATNASDARFAALRELSLKLQRRCVVLALPEALVDAAPTEHIGSNPGWEHPRVRAAAVEACVRVWGEPKLAELLTQLANAERRPDDAPTIALMRAVAQRGLPTLPATIPERERADLVTKWTRSIVAVACESKEGQVRVAAMEALGRISGHGRASLREEDWQQWWTERVAAQARVETRAP